MKVIRSLGVYPIRGVIGCCHLLVDQNKKCVLIDTGLFGEVYPLRKILGRLGLGFGDIEAILLTHGHLDHTGNLAKIRGLSNAPIFAHPLEQEHIDGTYPYTGQAKWCGRLESFGRRVLNYESATIDRPLHDDDVLPFWGGLRVVHLPGHTAGHCGFYSARYDLLFSGDLFGSYFFSIHLPPAILNSMPELIPGSMERVKRMNPALILPNHYDLADPELHKSRFVGLCEKLRVG